MMENTTTTPPDGRAKEFRCLCDITRVTNSPDITLREIINRIVELLPGGFRRRDAAWARITLNNEDFITRGCAVSEPKISADIIVRGKPAGMVEVGYQEGTPECTAGVFTGEERLLLEAVAEHLSAILTSRQAEEALRLSEEKFSKAFHVSPNIVILTELDDGRIIDINDSSLPLIGWTPQEIIGRRSIEIGFWGSDAIRRRVVERLKKDGRIRNVKIEWHHRSGESHSGKLSSELINIGGKPCIISVINDMTREKESQELLETVARSSPFGIFILQDGVFNYTNPQFESITGYSHAELHGRKLLNIVAAEDADVVAAGIIFTMREKNPRPCEYRLLSKNGQIKWVVQTVSRVHYRRGDAIIGNITDVTELKYLERKVVEYEELNKMKSDLLATVSHELRTPLATIKGYATMILDYFSRLGADETRDYLRAIDGSTDRLTKLVDNLLDTSRLDAGILKLQRSPTSISTLIRRLVEEAEVRNTGHTIVTRLGARLPRVNIDTKRICQVLDNLIDNAVKYSPSGTRITVFAERSGPDLLIGVSDQGPGIPEEELENIFERMYRIEKRFDLGPRGMGLGLYICQRLVQAHGGRIWAESTLGEGTTIKLVLPGMGRADREPETNGAVLSGASLPSPERKA